MEEEFLDAECRLGQLCEVITRKARDAETYETEDIINGPDDVSLRYARYAGHLEGILMAIVSEAENQRYGFTAGQLRESARAK